MHVMSYDLLVPAELALHTVNMPGSRTASSCLRSFQVLQAVQHLDIVDFVAHLKKRNQTASAKVPTQAQRLRNTLATIVSLPPVVRREAPERMRL